MRTNLTESVGTLLDPETHAKLRTAAAAHGRSVAEHLRVLIAESLGTDVPAPDARTVFASSDVEGTADLIVQIVTDHGGEWTRGRTINRLSKPRRPLAVDAIALAERQGRLHVDGQRLTTT